MSKMDKFNRNAVIIMMRDLVIRCCQTPDNPTVWALGIKAAQVVLENTPTQETEELALGSVPDWASGDDLSDPQ